MATVSGGFIGTFGAPFGVRSAIAQGAPPVTLNLNIDRELESIRSDARKLEIATVQTRAEKPREVGGAALELGDLLDRALAKAKGADEAASNFADRVGLLLSEINRARRDAEVSEVAPEERARKWTYERLRSEYRDLFKRCQVSSHHRSELTSAARRITSADSMRRYKAVESDTGVPWYVIGALHYREASLNFLGHLHNGDFLRLKTTQVPRNRPPGKWPPEPWDAERAWRLSANDALARYKDVPGWHVERMLFTFEDFNGWGYRSHPGYRTPYLWNYTQFYTRGGFPCDHCWSTTYVSKQAGLAAIIKAIAEAAPGQVKLTYEV